ncbi:MAG: DMT family transporter [Candidatus Rokubacteria bacterium]|nr:DMT family transporter [Candidatus Rokubacteria bacterium]
MLMAETVLLLANLIYATSYSATRVVLADVGPATLALARLVIGSAILVPVALAIRRGDPRRFVSTDRWNLFWMGLLGFAGAFAFAHWGLVRSTATNAALLITVEPISLMLLSPLLLGERLHRREALAAAMTLSGAALVVVNGVPGLTRTVAPHWRGDLLLVCSGLAYASYSLLGRGLLLRHSAMAVTAWSIAWGAAAMVPLALLEWHGGHRPVWTGQAITGVLYLAVVITALGYLAWNYALERVPAPRAAIFLNVQPLAGAVLGIAWLGEPLTVFTVVGGTLILAGLTLTVRRRR